MRGKPKAPPQNQRGVSAPPQTSRFVPTVGVILLHALFVFYVRPADRCAAPAYQRTVRLVSPRLDETRLYHAYCFVRVQELHHGYVDAECLHDSHEGTIIPSLPTPFVSVHACDSNNKFPAGGGSDLRHVVCWKSAEMRSSVDRLLLRSSIGYHFATLQRPPKLEKIHHKYI